jgi:hypothetical protein
LRFSSACIISVLVGCPPIVVAAAAGGNRDLTELSLEELTLEQGPIFVDPRSGQTVVPVLNTLEPNRFQLDAFFRYASAVPASSDLVAGQDTPAYATFDARAAWQWKPLEFSVVGRNLAQSHHREFPGGAEMERAFYAKVAGRF